MEMDIASVVKSFSPNADDELVAKRTTAINDIATKLDAIDSVGKAFGVANDLRKGIRASSIGGSLGDLAFAAVRATSVSFTREGSEAELLICTLAGVHRFLELQKQAGEERAHESTLLSAAFLSSLSFEESTGTDPVDKLWQSLVLEADALVESFAVQERARAVVDLPDDDAQGEMDNDGVVNAFEALSSNAVLDREELNFLWWCLSDWSTAIRAKVSSVSPGAAIVVAALEGGMKLEGLPLAAHVYATLRNVDSSDDSTLISLRDEAAQYREDLVKFLGASGTVQAFPEVFPALKALLFGDATESRSHAPHEWAKRILLEVSLAKAVS